MTFFKRRFGDYLLIAKARCDWDALKFGPSTQKLHEFLDTLQETTKYFQQLLQFQNKLNNDSARLQTT